MSLNVGDLIPIGGTGNAQPADVLVGKTFTNDDGPDKVGTMPNNGPSTAETINLTSQNQEYTVAQGYHSGLRKIKAVISGLVASVIKAGTTVGGIVGTFTSDATASAGHILSGMTAYVNGNKITGSVPSKAAATYTPGTTDQTIAAGQYLSGIQTIKGDANLIASNIKSGTSIFGVTGTYQTPSIKSIQRGSYTINSLSSTTITISSVDLNSSIVIFSNRFISGANAAYGIAVYAALINSTTLEIGRGGSSSKQQVEWQVIEFNNVKSVQRGTVTMTAPSSSATVSTSVTISAVDLSKSICLVSFKTSSGGFTSDAFITIQFNSSTELSLSTYATYSDTTQTAYWQVIEFK